MHVPTVNCVMMSPYVHQFLFYLHSKEALYNLKKNSPLQLCPISQDLHKDGYSIWTVRKDDYIVAI